MKKLNRNEAIAVFAGIAVLTYLFFSSQLMNLFQMENNNTASVGASGENGSVSDKSLATGFKVQDIVAGQGALAEPGDLVTAHYVGQLTSGKVFDSSRDRNTPIQFVLGSGQVIRGWDEGIMGMRVGGKRVLTIAPDYAYGDNDLGTIPANSTLVFEVELLDVKKSQ